MKFNFLEKIWGRKENQDKESDKDENIKDNVLKDMMSISDFKIIPLISEKSSLLTNNNQYVFLVDKRINKTQLKIILEKNFNIKIDKVRTINYKKRIRGITRLKNVRPSFKKAIIKLKKGYEIPLINK